MSNMYTLFEVWDKMCKMNEIALTDKEKGEIVKIAADSPNPVKTDSTGKIAEPQGNASGKTFEPEDIELLADLKKELDSLYAKVVEMENKGKKTKNIQKRVKSMQEKVDKLSDDLNKGYEVNHGQR